MDIENHFTGYITDDEYRNCLSISNYEDHPLYYLFVTKDIGGHVALAKQNTIESYKTIQKNDVAWLNNKKKEIVSHNINNAVSAFGELRCYGDLLSTFGFDHVKPIAVSKYPTPDFEVSNNVNELLYVEVNTLQINNEEGRLLHEFLSQNNNQTNAKVRVRTHSVAPFGRNNARCITENVIHKLCQVKQEEKQFDDMHPSILWIDVQDKHTNLLSRRSENPSPILMHHNMIQSNELWYAFYAQKGFPIYEHYSPFSVVKSKIDLQHNGRFHVDNVSKTSAVIFSFPHSIIIYENPYAKKRIPTWFVEKAFRLRWFQYHGSKIDYPEGILLEQLEIDRRIVLSFKDYI